MLVKADPSLFLSKFQTQEKLKISYFSGLVSVFMRNVKIISRYKIQLIIGLINTVVVFSLYYYVSLLVPNQKISFYDTTVRSTEFIAIGMLTVDLTTRAFNNGLGSFVSEMRQGTFVSLVVSPYGIKKYILTEILFEITYSFILSFFYYIPLFLIFPIFKSYSFTLASFVSFLVIICSLFFFFYSFTLVVSTISLIVKKSRELSLIFVAILQLLSGALFPLSVFPHWLRLIALVSPYTLSINALRLCLFRKATIFMPEVWRSVLFMLLTSTGLLILFSFVFRGVYNKLKRTGEIQGY